MNKSIGAKIPRSWNNRAWGNLPQSRYVSTNFEYSPSSTIARFKAIPITDRDSTKWQKSPHLGETQQTFPDSNQAFFELIKKSAKDKKQKNDLSLWNKYCREVKMRVNERNITPRMITTFFTFLSQTDYKNDRLISEVLNRCIFRLGEFDLVHMCALLNALGRMRFRSAYFLYEARKKLLGEGGAYFERHSPHYVCLLLNSLVRLGNLGSSDGGSGGSDPVAGEEGSSDAIPGEDRSGDDGSPERQLLPRMVERIQHRRAEEYSLVGLSLLLHNVSKLGLHQYYHLFTRFEEHIVKVKNDWNIIQVVNLLTAYGKTSRLSLPLLNELLHCPALQGGKNNRNCCVHHLARLLNVSLSFVLHGKERRVPPGESDSLRQIGKQCVHLFRQMYRQMDTCRGKDLPLVCLMLSRNKGLIIRRKEQSDTGDSPYLIFSPPKSTLNNLFAKITTGVKRHINRYNHVQLSTVLYCYASYDILDRTLFYLIKVRCLKTFSSFGQKSFSFLFSAFKRMNVEDGVFETSCLNKMAQLGHFSCVQSFGLALSAYASVRGERQREDLSRLVLWNFSKVVPSVDASKGASLNVDASRGAPLSIATSNVAAPNLGEQISRLTSLLAKVSKFPRAEALDLLASRYPNYEHTLSTANCTSLLTSVATLCASLTEKEDKPSWRGYYHFVNSLTEKILADSNLYRRKDLLVSFLHGGGKTFPSFVKCTRVDERKMFYFAKILRTLLPHVYPFIGAMDMGEVAVLVEGLSKENYSREAMAAVGSASGVRLDELGAAVLRRVKRLLRGEATEEEADENAPNIRIASAATVWKGLLSLGVHDGEVFQLMVQRCILCSPCLSSLTSLSQAINYVCVYSSTSEPTLGKRHVGLLRFLLNVAHRLMVNEGVVHHNCNDSCNDSCNDKCNYSCGEEGLLSEENLGRFTSEPLWGKALTGLCEAVMMILPHVCNVGGEEPAEWSHPSDSHLQSIAFRPLGSPPLLHFYLTILKMTEQVRRKKKNHHPPFRRDELSDVVEQIRQCALGMQMRSAYVELPLFTVLVLGGAASS
ncbi:hypothetical protein PVMG_00255 [Plasmodium vivax Mauritania I]|uniref:Uncharacterized protein n=1 Tax=Plasmodium vivax Mauritania I TaxID=1035515 RepID=A0A0J9T8S2_PLAVI|nr:hypothetical protein PVMG_00255 [Plasmodium vivax Mauritania I]